MLRRVRGGCCGFFLLATGCCVLVGSILGESIWVESILGAAVYSVGIQSQNQKERYNGFSERC